MSHLNPNATEWKPTGNNEHGMTDFALPPATVLPGERESDEPSRGASAGTPPAASAATAAAAAASSTPPSYIPSYMTGGDPTIADELANIDWEAEFKKLMELTGELIDRQLKGLDGDEVAGTAHNPSGGLTAAAAATTSATPNVTAGGAAGEAKPSAVPLPTTYASAVKGAAVAARKPTTLGVASTSSAAAAAAAALADVDDSASTALTMATTKGGTKHHWKKLTKAQQRQEQSQRNAFEAFANALLHSVSPFMAPLREKCKTSLPHIKVDQRFGKSGHPETAIAQFIVAPLVTNYRPRHFHDVAPGELMEFHYDFSLVLQTLPSAYAIHIGYGPTWKRYAVPYCYVACREYRKEVLALCPEETPNSRSEAIYEDDVVKDITDLLLKRGEGLELLETMSFWEAMRKRVDLYPLYDAFASIFQPLENYQVEIIDIRAVPSRFLVKTSRLAVEAMPQPVVLDEDVTWDELPEYSRVIVQGGGAANSSNNNSSRGATKDGTSGSAAANSAKGSATPTPAVASTAAIAGRVKGNAAPTGKLAKAAEGNVSWQMVVPLALSGVCVLTTVALVVLKKRKQ
ncbi:putative mitochondrial hypothetical protein [Leptomonas pyrrhocoris]|uniref:Uncharacterized protein n=1 Tax=Leptomonas pyrrhocoris TaxID=157538 RepID=A0A0N0DRB2_LEPPY|nr:putative mitochondrial hypothetical protein [Leptomonas pyrrhocoris]XP_015652638.1 putative mitochondrial hypothetical protein [Leptomonas pyrrhocoris]KPA74198.1 putative mitochondrial hypothetical protein [Leptomonas pyrrhocoris]KPA74199.1 putative mitochondrial hypothetical protein [Leptomonas pyrrhocoris]|eukprot:XP_015652637.1 putative mitochondrial hypothetical protein [Leptomonas pyrrhocoris]